MIPIAEKDQWLTDIQRYLAGQKEIEWMTCKDVADLLKITVSSVKRLISKGILLAFKPGGRDWLIHPESVKYHFYKSSNLSLN